MKILLTSDWSIDDVNGVAVSIMNLYKELKSLGHDIKVLSLSNDHRYHKKGDFYYIKSFALELYPNVRATTHFHNKYVRELIAWKPDVVHSQCEFFTYSIANIIAVKSRAPIVHTYHTLYEHYTDYLLKNEKITLPILHLFMKLRLADADLVIAPTEKTYNSIKNIVSGKIAVVPTGIDLKKYQVDIDQAKIDQIKDKYKIDSSKKILLYLGRVSKEKNIKEVILFYKNLLGFREDVLLLVVGGGPYLDTLKELCAKENLQDKVIFTGLVKPEETAYYYNLSDIFVSASVSETQGLTYIEALANGLPPVCRNDQALLGVIENGYNGFIYNNYEEYIDAINSLLDDEDLRNDIALKAKKSCNKYSIENFGKNVLDAYQIAIENFKAKPKLMPANVYRLLRRKDLLPPLDEISKKIIRKVIFYNKKFP